MKRKKIHLFHPLPNTLTPACRPQLTDADFHASENGSAVTCKRCIHLIASGWVNWVKGSFGK